MKSMRLIDADDFKRKSNMGTGTTCQECQQNSWRCEFCIVYTKMDVCEMIDDSPTVQPKQSYWIHLHPQYSWQYRHYLCGNCNQEQKDSSKYCPNCGAFMKEIKQM